MLVNFLLSVIVMETAVLVALPFMIRDHRKRQQEALQDEIRRLEQELKDAVERADRIERELQKELQRISTLISRTL